MKTSFIILRKDAEKLIDNYIRDIIQNGLVPPTIGGVIEMESFISANALEVSVLEKLTKIKAFRGGEILRGLATWFCWEKADKPTNAEFFIAPEIHPGLILVPGDIQFPLHKELSNPVEIIKYNNRTASQLLGHKSLNLSSGPKTITRGENVINPATGTALFKINDFIRVGPKDTSGKVFNKFGFGVFETEKVADEVDRFLNQYNTHGMKYLRYFFGYDSEKESNTIRVILVGVDKDGNNLMPPENVSKLEELGTNDPIMLENSWPPMS